MCVCLHLNDMGDDMDDDMAFIYAMSEGSAIPFERISRLIVYLLIVVRRFGMQPASRAPSHCIKYYRNMYNTRTHTQTNTYNLHTDTVTV